MDLKQQAYQLFKTGMSYGMISKKLGIGKTTAYDYVREVKMNLNEGSDLPLQDNSDLGAKDRLDKIFTDETRSGVLKDKTVISSEKNKKPFIKEFTGDELVKKKFDSLDFKGKFLALIGKPSKLFSGIIWGLPKGGKSNFALRFADYLQEYFGEVVYIAAEEGESVTLQEKFKEIGGSKVTVAESRNREEISEYLKSKLYDFVFIDSINNAGIDSDYLEILKHENPKKSFISIVQATKGGNFKGDQALTHNCDFIIKVVAGIAYHTGRFNTTTEISIFDGPLYDKNPDEKKKRKEKEEATESTSTLALLKPKEDLTKKIDIAHLLGLLPVDIATEKETTKKPFILPLPKFAINEINFPVLKNSTQKNNLPSVPIKMSSKNLVYSERKKKPENGFLKVIGGVLVVTALYEIFKPKGENNIPPKDKEK